MRSLRRTVELAGAALVVVALSLILHALSAWIARAHLQHEAEARLSALEAGQPLWRWTLRDRRDLVAGRPFGAATMAREHDGLRITSLDGSPFDLGLPVMQPIDLAHWPLLRLELERPPGSRIDLLVQANERAPVCVSNDIGTSDSAIDLRELAWHTESGSPCPPPGLVAYLLRLRMTLPAGSSVRWDSAAFAAPGSRVAAGPDIELSPHPDPRYIPGGSAPPVNHLTPSPAPVFHLSTAAVPEQWLAWRDRIRRIWPGAVISIGDTALQPAPHTPTPPWIGWLACTLYLAVLAWYGFRRAEPWAWRDLALILAGPLWLIAGLQWGLHPSPPGSIAFGAALLYAARVEWRERPRAWHWLGNSWRDWLWPLAPLLIAWGWAQWSAQGFVAPEWRHAVTYLGWATLQQWLMLAVAMGCLERSRLFPVARVLMVATLFALLHTPNHLLMQLCLLAELWWGWCFLRSRALLPVALAHAGAALLVESGWVGGALRSLEVSARFFL